METQNLVISFDYSWFLAKNLAYAECPIMKFHYRNSSSGNSPSLIPALCNILRHFTAYEFIRRPPAPNIFGPSVHNCLSRQMYAPLQGMSICLIIKTNHSHSKKYHHRTKRKLGSLIRRKSFLMKMNVVCFNQNIIGCFFSLHTNSHKEIGLKFFPQYQLDFHVKTDPGPSWVSNIS